MRKKQNPKVRLVSKDIPLYKIAPNLVTIMSLCIGVSAIRYALDAKWEIAAALIIFSVFLDGLDGRLARLLNSTSKFGAQLDSLADMVCFGVAPAVLMFLWSLKYIPYKGVGWAVVLFYVTCSALRLARFNSVLDDEKQKAKLNHYFTGVAIPAAAGLAILPLIMTFELVPGGFSSWFIAAYMLLPAVLMISTIPTFSFKKVSVKKVYVPLLLLIVAIFIGGVLLEPWIALPFLGLVFWCTIPYSCYTYYTSQSA
ncbi:MAG: CDP-diacylglycerol--serine O-phosphatidyltransferase [Rickettsiales bacterium]